MVALTAARLALIPAPEFRRLALAHPAVHRKIMRQVRPVVARFAAIQQNRERLAALGTMAAGLAHELNNPAAAARRSAADLAEALGVIGAAIREFTDAGIEREDAARIADLRDKALKQCADRDTLSALDAADAEDEMRDRLEDLGVPDAWRLAEPMSSVGAVSICSEAAVAESTSTSPTAAMSAAVAMASTSLLRLHLE